MWPHLLKLTVTLGSKRGSKNAGNFLSERRTEKLATWQSEAENHRVLTLFP